MHHSFYGTDRTSCGKPLRQNMKVTGLDSAVTCGECQNELAYYRYYFPQASNRVELVDPETGRTFERRPDGYEGRLVERAALQGGAR